MISDQAVIKDSSLYNNILCAECVRAHVMSYDLRVKHD